eukprot:15394947-Heterocapsa_arctica.AAC.1
MLGQLGGHGKRAVDRAIRAYLITGEARYKGNRVASRRQLACMFSAQRVEQIEEKLRGEMSWRQLKLGDTYTWSADECGIWH